MPVWADFMKEALALHPEWNGDWALPANVRKAEIDIRNGALIRELDLVEASAVATPTPTPGTNTKLTDSDGNPIDDLDPIAPPRDIYVTNVPPEFRRIELFVVGTVPNRSLITLDEEPVDVEEKPEKPTPSPTPVSETWQEGAEPPSANTRPRTASPAAEISGSVTVMICPVSKMRATPLCPDKQSKTFTKGSEPKDFCTVHR